MKNALRHFGEIERRILHAGGCVVLLDFDGTLAPIVADRKRAGMDAASRKALGAVVARFPAAIVTGRTLADVRRRAGVRGLAYAGNHGLERYVGGVLSKTVVPRGKKEALSRARLAVKRLALEIRGVELEDKTDSLSVHYRHAPRVKHSVVAARLREIVRRTGGTRQLRLLGGVCVFNILPEVNRNKGTAAKALQARLSKGTNHVPVFIGDDVTDEDAFRALRGGITVHVGKPRPTAAAYRLDAQKDVALFLQKIAGIKRVS